MCLEYSTHLQIYYSILVSFRPHEQNAKIIILFSSIKYQSEILFVHAINGWKYV